MKKTLFLIVLNVYFLLFSGCSSGQKIDPRNSLKIVFYNCENFFDTYDDNQINDNEFLPKSKNSWTIERYNIKVKNISHVIYATDSINFPDVVGLSEIENKTVLDDLVNSSFLKKADYHVVHYESSDDRGIDVALLYNAKKVKVMSSRPVPVVSSGIKLREILYVKAIVFNTDTLNIFVNHWKSRSEGVAETQPKRILYASVLKKITDSLFTKNPAANILIMGDFNDEPGDISVSATLGALPLAEKPQQKKLYNLFYNFYEAQQGSYFYSHDKKWNMIDQIILSGNLFSTQKNKLHYVQGSAEIFRKNWMLYKSSKGEMLPNKTFSGTTYHGGYSDHLPVTILLGKQSK
jgi:predicted extracellular nuclease